MDDEQLADSFADFFADKIDKLSTRCTYQERDVSLPFSNVFLRYSQEEIETAIDCLKRSRAQGFDEIPGLVIKDLKKVLALPLCWLFNSISEYKDIPKAWKMSRVTPIFKKGNPKDIANYRPVSNVSSLSKVFERTMLIKMMQFSELETLFGNHQHGFIPNRSVITAALTLQDYISTKLDENKIVLLYSADLSAAFDMLRPDALVEVLVNIGLNPNFIELVYNFLKGRSNYIQVGSASSSVKEVPIGCVQGSVMGPILFNIYTRKLGELFPPEIFCMAYADDSYVGVSCNHSDIEGGLETLRAMASQHYNWLSYMGMVCNKLKTEFIVFNRFKNNKQNLTLNIDLDFIKPVKTMKVLGITFQEDLKWTKHISKSISSANSMFLPLKYVNKYLNRTQFKSTVNAHFVSRLTFASPVWYKSISGKDLQRIDVNMNRVTRLILRDPKFKGSNREL